MPHASTVPYRDSRRIPRKLLKPPDYGKAVRDVLSDPLAAIKREMDTNELRGAVARYATGVVSVALAEISTDEWGTMTSRERGLAGMESRRLSDIMTAGFAPLSQVLPRIWDAANIESSKDGPIVNDFTGISSL